MENIFSPNTTAKPVRFKNGKLKVMHVTDTHYDFDNVEASSWLLACACDKEKPDIVIVTGDNVTNQDNAEGTKKLIDKLMNIFDQRNIPAAITFGNHDSERGAMSREELMAYYNTHSSSVSVDDGNELSGCGTYIVPVLSSSEEKIKFNLWVFDSNDYDDEGHYGCVLPDQVEWYKKKSDSLTAANGGEKVYSLAFQHIIVDDIYDALKKTTPHAPFSFRHMYNKNDYYMFNPEKTNFGTLTETPCSGYHNYGQFDAMAEKGDVLAIFSGHDHTNAFGVKHKGIDISNTVSTRYNRDKFSSQYGYRILEINENNTSVYTSRVEHWYSMFSISDIKTFKEKGDEFGAELIKNVLYNGFCRKVFEKTIKLLAKTVTFRKISYKD